jgi:arsenite methyltransferase
VALTGRILIRYPMSAGTSTNELHAAIAERYGALVAGCDSLSCGRALERGAPAPGEVVLDLGCGRGRDVLEAARRVGPVGLAFGVDLSAEMIAAARDACPASLPNVRFLTGSLERVELVSASVELVISNCAINHAPDKVAVYGEIHRLLRPGGRFVVSDVIAEEELPERVRTDRAAWAACYGGAMVEAEYLAAIRTAGFADVEVLERSEPYERHGVTLRSITVRAVRARPNPPDEEDP